MHVIYLSKKLVVGILILISIISIAFITWNLLPSSRIHNRLNSTEVKIDKQEYLALISNLKRIYAKNNIKYVSVTLSGDTGDKNSMVFWRPNPANPSNYITGCILGDTENNLTDRNPFFYINKDQYKFQSENINRDLNYCIGLLFLNKTDDISQIKSLQKYLDSPSGTKKIIFRK